MTMLPRPLRAIIRSIHSAAAGIPPAAYSVIGAAVSLAIVHVNSAAALPSFTNVAADLGITHLQSTTPSIEPMSGGVAVLDYDGDGREDLFFTRPDLPAVLYRNTGFGFQDVSAAAGFTNIEPGSGVASGDINNDGYADLVVMGVQSTRDYLYINDGHGKFTEQAIARGTDITSPPGSLSRKSQGVALGDYDGDGYLDIMTSDHSRPMSSNGSRLLHNMGAANPGHFEDVTHAPDWTSIAHRWQQPILPMSIASSPNSLTSITTAIPTS